MVTSQANWVSLFLRLCFVAELFPSPLEKMSQSSALRWRSSRLQGITLMASRQKESRKERDMGTQTDPVLCTNGNCACQQQIGAGGETACRENKLRSSPERSVTDAKGKKGSIKKKAKKFPFQKLPTDCKLKVFLYLSLTDKGNATRVCHEWHDLMKLPSLWTDIDFTVFRLCNDAERGHNCTLECYRTYELRIKKLMKFLSVIGPLMHRFCFEYDIYDGWLSCIEELLLNSNCRDLHVARLNWKDTPVKPFWISNLSTNSRSAGCADLVSKHRLRQRRFVNFFDFFTSKAPNVRSLALPFDWSLRSVRFMARLQNLHTLILEKYFVFQTVSQSVMDELMKSTKSLRKLVLEVWTPSAHGLILYNINSASLEHLDISRCRGFYVKKVQLPNVREFRVARHPWNGPLVSADSINIPCLYQMLSQGAPKLQKINDHTLDADWASVPNPALETVMKSVCSCRKHKAGWAM